jgi:RNA polymerase sigma-70 factor (ECF subfamily)
MTESLPSLNQLLIQARAGDAVARDRLFAACRNYLAVVARAEIGSWFQAKVDASDLVQQTMLDAHRGLTNFRGHNEAEWLAWLRQILSHNAADFVRHYGEAAKRKAAREVPLSPADSQQSNAARFEPAAEIETPSEMLMRRETELQLADAIAGLPEDYQEVVVLRNLQRLPFDEVARRMGRSRPAAQMLWMRAIRTLRERSASAAT